jgi:hypothetical protein
MSNKKEPREKKKTRISYLINVGEQSKSVTLFK